ncbi:hypothetical protein [Nonomuraea sp. NPDC046570]|uniref:DUF7638 domain-containing protein n=1 Tax=Nonomuraea sp. NPDC046570 TaxID=3155255 RepID=UPI0033CC6CA7
MDDERIDGAWYHVWLRTWHEYYIVDLAVFADGAIKCDGWTDLSGLRKMLASGKVSVRNPDAPEQATEVSKWQSRQPHPVTADGFLAEVADEIEDLNGRPTTERFSSRFAELKDECPVRSRQQRSLRRMRQVFSRGHDRREPLRDVLLPQCTPVNAREDQLRAHPPLARDQALALPSIGSPPPGPK